MLARSATTRRAIDSTLRHAQSRNYAVAKSHVSGVSQLASRQVNPAISTSVLHQWVREKSSSAAMAEEEIIDEQSFSGNIEGHSAAAEATSNMQKSNEEAWMINLGRGNNNEWLTGPRPEEWFTGLAPSECPGKLTTNVRYGNWIPVSNENWDPIYNSRIFQSWIGFFLLRILSNFISSLNACCGEGEGSFWGSSSLLLHLWCFFYQLVHFFKNENPFFGFFF